MKHSMADFSALFLVPHTLGPDVRDNVTVKLQRKMVTGGKNFTAYMFSVL